MARIVSVTLAAVLAVGVGLATAQEKAASTKTLSANGTVKTVSAGSLTVESGKKSMSFTVDSTTRILANGATAETKEKKAAGAAGLSITNVVHTGDVVRVMYREAGGIMNAAEVQLRTARLPKPLVPDDKR